MTDTPTPAARPCIASYVFEHDCSIPFACTPALIEMANRIAIRQAELHAERNDGLDAHAPA